MAGKSTGFSRTQILRDVPTFSGELANWVKYKEKLDDVLFFHDSSIREELQGQERPGMYVLVANDVTVIPTYVELPTFEAKPIPEQWKGNADKEAQWNTAQDLAQAAAKLEVATPALTPGSVIGHVILILPSSFGFKGRFQVVAGRTAASRFLTNPAYDIWERHNDELFRILYHTCKNVAHSLLQKLRPIDGSGARGNGQEASNRLRNRYKGRSEARVRSLLAEMQSCTFHADENPDVYFARLYRLRLQLQEVGCTVDDYQLKANALSGLSEEYIPMLNQLWTMKPLDLNMINNMFRKVYVNDVLPAKAKKGNLLRRYRREAAMTITEQTFNAKRDVSQTICHKCKEKGHYANKCPARKSPAADTTAKWCSLHKTRSHTDNECMTQQGSQRSPATQSAPSVSALPATTIPPAAETCSFTFVASSPLSSTRKGGLQLLVDSGCSSYMVDPVTIPNAERHLRGYQELRPPHLVYGAGSHELLATGTAMLKLGVKNTDNQQRQVSMSVLLVPGLGRNLLSSSAALANRVETTISSFLTLTAKGETFPLRADNNLYFLDAILLPDECATFEESSDVTYCVNEKPVQKEGTDFVNESQKEETGVANDTCISVSNCDACPVTTRKPHSQPKGAIHEALPLELMCTDLAGRGSLESCANSHYARKPIGHYARTTSVDYIDDYCDAPLPGDQLRRICSDPGGECHEVGFRASKG